jgi:hypothetical protein
MSPISGAHHERSDVLFRVARGLVRLVEALLIMAALFSAPIISRGRSITD